ncbi:MAG: hypothetical protein ACTS6P_01125 [Candidatus Hodgkinia cicadicola]
MLNEVERSADFRVLRPMAAEVDDLFKLIALVLWKTAPFWLPEDKLTFGSRG